MILVKVKKSLNIHRIKYHVNFLCVIRYMGAFVWSPNINVPWSTQVEGTLGVGTKDFCKHIFSAVKRFFKTFICEFMYTSPCWNGSY